MNNIKNVDTPKNSPTSNNTQDFKICGQGTMLQNFLRP
jgi:hypothetical protein